MEINSGKSSVFSRNAVLYITIDNNVITSQNKNELLGIVLDLKLSFEDQINSLCKKANQKFNVLERIYLFIYLFTLSFLKTRKRFYKVIIILDYLHL